MLQRPFDSPSPRLPVAGALPAARRQTILQLVQSGRTNKALEAVTLSIATHPQSLFLRIVMGTLLLKTDDPSSAAEAFKTAIKLDKTSAPAHSGLADACKYQGRTKDAARSYRKALDLDPALLTASNNLATMLNDSGRFDRATDVLNRAIALSPDAPTLHYTLGNAFKGLGQLEQACTAFQRETEIAPKFASAHFHLGLMHRLLGNLPAAVDSFRTVVALNPGHDRARSQMILQMAHMCDWDWCAAFENAPDGFRNGKTKTGPFPFLLFEDDPLRQLKHAQTYADMIATPAPPSAPLALTGDRRIRIGYVSCDFHDHATMHLLAGLFDHHDRTRFEVHALSYGPASDDAYRARLLKNVDGFHDIAAASDADGIARARTIGLDIAVDLKGFTGGSRPGLFRGRAAPIQIAFLGYPGPAGLPEIDYTIADPIVVPPAGRAGFSEHLILMPNSYQINDAARVVPPDAPSRQACGLPENGFVYCCFNSGSKISPREFDIWMRLLTKVKGSVLWLLRGNAWAETNLRSEAAKRGVDPDRLIWADRCALPDHLARHHCADLFLDTFHYNAHTTASDALWAGLPVLTYPGQQFAARVAASLNISAGMGDMVVDSVAAYESAALTLAQHPDRLAQIKARLSSARATCALFDTAGFVAALEGAYEKALAADPTDRQDINA